jgi:hypothetical protein
MPDWIRKLVKFTPAEDSILQGAVDVGIATNKMEAIHIAVDLLRGHVEAKKVKT